MAGAPTLLGIFTEHIVVGVGDMAVSNNTSQVISTYALGSCIGVIAYDPIAEVGGILHFMLPDSTLSSEQAQSRPSMFCDVGMKAFLSEFESMRSKLVNMKIMIAGGASVIGKSDFFKIGSRNQEAIHAYLGKVNLKAQIQDLGGLNNRTVHLNMKDGTVKMKTPTANKKFSLL